MGKHGASQRSPPDSIVNFLRLAPTRSEGEGRGKARERWRGERGKHVSIQENNFAIVPATTSGEYNVLPIMLDTLKVF